MWEQRENRAPASVESGTRRLPGYAQQKDEYVLHPLARQWLRLRPHLKPKTQCASERSNEASADRRCHTRLVVQPIHAPSKKFAARLHSGSPSSPTQSSASRFASLCTRGTL